MNREFTQGGFTLLASGMTSWMTARHYYLADVDKKFESSKMDIKDLKTETSSKL